MERRAIFGVLRSRAIDSQAGASMKALQLHYTSCRRGQSGRPGFQVRASSPGILPDEQREIERKGVYRPPREAPEEPTQEQLDRDFPRAFRFYFLESGRRAVTFSTYTGKDYSGRWGNFFAHTLIVDSLPGEADPWPEISPIDYYEWKGWRTGLEETDGSEPDLLENLEHVELTEASRAESFRLEELQAFLREEPGRQDLLARMGRAVLLGQATSRPVVVRTDPLDSTFWMASVLKLFPPRYAWELSFSTYQEDPRGAARINATVAGSDFRFSEAERLYQFYLFDPENGLATELPESLDDYPSLAAHWLAEQPETLRAFFLFLRGFKPFPFGSQELLAAAELFRAGRRESTELTGRRLAEVLTFAEQWVTEAGRVVLLEDLGGVFLRASDPGQLAGDGRVLRFLAEAAEGTAQPAHRQLVFQIWLRWLERSLRAGAADMDALQQGWRDLRRILRHHEKDLAIAFLDRRPFERLTADRLELSCRALVWLLECTKECLAILGRAPAWQQDEIRALLPALVMAGGREGQQEGAWEVALALGRGDSEALVGLCDELASLGVQGASEVEAKRLQTQVGRALGKVLRGEPRAVATEVRRRLESSAKWQLLFGDWLSRLSGARDPVEAFEAYDHEVLQHLPDFRERARGDVLNSLLAALGEKRSAEQAARWLLSGQTQSFPSQLERDCIALANRQVSLDLKDTASESLAVKVEERGQALDLRLRPNHPYLRRLLQHVRESRPVPRAWRVEALQKALEGIDVKPYGLFLEGFLLPTLERARSYKEHQGLLVALFQEPCGAVFARVYSRFFLLKRSPRELGPLQAGIKFWLYFDSGDPAMAPFLPWQRELRGAMLRGLGALSDRSFSLLKRRLENAKLADRARIRWHQIDEELSSRRKGFLCRILKGGRWF